MSLFSSLRRLLGNNPPVPVIPARPPEIPASDADMWGVTYEPRPVRSRDYTPPPAPKPKQGAEKAPALPSDDWRMTDADIAGIVVMIEYVDAAGQESRRRIRIDGIVRHPAKPMLISAFCFERMAKRSFRADRIKCYIDADGEVHEPSAYLHEILNVPADENAPQAPGVSHRQQCEAGWRILVDMAWADGSLDPREVEVIVDFIVTEALLKRIDADDADWTALRRFIGRQRPPEIDPDRWIERIDREDQPVQRRLIAAAKAVAAADGVIDPAEEELLDMIMDALD